MTNAEFCDKYNLPSLWRTIKIYDRLYQVVGHRIVMFYSIHKDNSFRIDVEDETYCHVGKVEKLPTDDYGKTWIIVPELFPVRL